MAKQWLRLTMVWAFYYFMSWTLGQDPRFMKLVLWGGAALVGAFTVPMFIKHVSIRHLPLEGVLLIGFMLWALPGFFIATDMALFMRHLKMVMEATLILIAVSWMLENSGAAKWFYLAYVGVAVVGILWGVESVSMEQIADTRVVSRIAKANGIGFYCALAILGNLALWGETKKLWQRVALAGASLPALYGIVISASRTAFVALFAMLVLWTAFCLVGTYRIKLKTVVGAVLVLLLAYWIFLFVLQETYMGVRVMKGVQLEDGSSQTRLQLVLIGLGIFLKYPIFGCGLGQFGVMSGTGLYAHNEFVEILVATGLPGLILYYSIYLIAWRRLSWSLTRLCDPVLRYRVNMARVSLLVLVLFGAISRPNFLSQSTMFLLAIVVGMSHWAEQTARRIGRDPRLGSAPPSGFSEWRSPMASNPLPGSANSVAAPAET